MTYQVRRTRCMCHPETCCCPDYEVIDSKGDVFVRTMDEKKAKKIAVALTEFDVQGK